MTSVTLTLRGRVFELLLDAMYRFRRDDAFSFQKLAWDLDIDQVLGALWLAGHLEMPVLQQAAAARLHAATATGEAARATRAARDPLS